MNVTWNKISFGSAGNWPSDLLLPSPVPPHPPASISCFTLAGPQDTRLQISLPLAAGIQNIHGNQSLTPGRRQQHWKAPFCFYIYSSVNWQLGGSLSSIRLGCTFLPSFVSSFHLGGSQPRLRDFSDEYLPSLQPLPHLSRSLLLKHCWLGCIFLNKTQLSPATGLFNLPTKTSHIWGTRCANYNGCLIVSTPSPLWDTIL